MWHNIHAVAALLVPAATIYGFVKTRPFEYEMGFPPRITVGILLAVLVLVVAPLHYGYPSHLLFIHYGSMVFALLFIRSSKLAAWLATAWLVLIAILSVLLGADRSLWGQPSLSPFTDKANMVRFEVLRSVDGDALNGELPRCEAVDLPMPQEKRDEIVKISQNIKMRVFQRLWHSPLTGIYKVEHVPAELVFRGGNLEKQGYRALILEPRT